MARILYSGTRNASSWAFRAWLALKEAGLAFEEEIVDLRMPQRREGLARIAAFSPPSAVPVLVEDGVVIYDSLAIMEYASERAAGALLPGDALTRAQARSLTAWQHSGLSGICPRLSFESAFYPDRRAMTPEETGQADRLFAVWEASLNAHRGGFLAGGLSLADLAFVPTVVRLVAHDPDLAAWPLTRAWIERLLARPSVGEWMDEARALPPVRLPDYDA